MNTHFDQEISRMSEQVERTGERVKEQFARSGPVRGRAETQDGSVSVQVRPGGLPTEIKLTSMAVRSDPQALANQIVRLANLATRRAGERMYYALLPTLGSESERDLTRLGYQPIPDDDEDNATFPGS